MTTNYLLHGKLITHMTVDYTDWDEVAQQDVLHFFYDAQSRPAKVRFNGEMYTYVHNLQGDVVGILDSDGELVVEYKYDAWGKLLSTDGTLADTLGKRNPFRYRGYVYDEESGLYYLRSRYYNSEWGRFVNSDTAIIPGLLLCNSFTYCSNNPIKRIDASGHAWYDGIVNAWNTFTSFVQECFQAQAQADIIAAEQRVYAVNKTINSVKNGWNKLKSSVSNWWENTAKPWLNKTKNKVKTLWNNVKEYVSNALHAQQQADILSAQMTYNAGMKVINWLSNNWKDVVDWTGIVYTGIVLALETGVKAGVIVIAPWAVTAMTVADVGFWIYSIGEKLKWW